MVFEVSVFGVLWLNHTLSDIFRCATERVHLAGDEGVCVSRCAVRASSLRVAILEGEGEGGSFLYLWESI